MTEEWKMEEKPKPPTGKKGAAIEVEKPKPPTGKKGVMAKRTAINEATKKMESGVKALQGEIKEEAREFNEATKKMESGVKALQGEIKKATDDFRAYAKDFYFG